MRNVSDATNVTVETLKNLSRMTIMTESGTCFKAGNCHTM